MKSKRAVGFILLIVGIAVILFANYQKGRVSEAKKNISEGSGLFSLGGSAAEQIGSVATGAMQKKASSYDRPLMLLQIGGIILVIIGGACLFCCRCKK